MSMNLTLTVDRSVLCDATLTPLQRLVKIALLNGASTSNMCELARTLNVTRVSLYTAIKAINKGEVR